MKNNGKMKLQLSRFGRRLQVSDAHTNPTHCPIGESPIVIFILLMWFKITHKAIK